MEVERCTAVGLYKMKLSSRGGNSFASNTSSRSRFTSMSSRSVDWPRASYIKYIHNDSPAPLFSLPTFPVWQPSSSVHSLSNGIKAFVDSYRINKHLI